MTTLFVNIVIRDLPFSIAWSDPEGGGGGHGVRTPLKIHINTGFVSNTGRIP